MKYTARHVRRFLEQGKIDPDIWQKRFPSVLETRVPGCSECEDHKNNLCEGGKNPVDCLLAEKTAGNQLSGTSPAEKPIKKRAGMNQWNGRARGKRMPPGANKAFDQSRI
jgi:hypothetical protein